MYINVFLNYYNKLQYVHEALYKSTMNQRHFNSYNSTTVIQLVVIKVN